MEIYRESKKNLPEWWWRHATARGGASYFGIDL